MPKLFLFVIPLPHYIVPLSMSMSIVPLCTCTSLRFSLHLQNRSTLVSYTLYIYLYVHRINFVQEYLYLNKIKETFLFWKKFLEFHVSSLFYHFFCILINRILNFLQFIYIHIIYFLILILE